MAFLQAGLLSHAVLNRRDKQMRVCNLRDIMFMQSLVVAILVALVVELTPAQTPSVSPIATSTASGSPNAVDQVLQLTGQLDQRLLTTVYWCLGTLVTVFLVLIGYNWFVNFRVHERDFRELKNDISTGLNAAVVKIELEAKAGAEEAKAQVRKSAETYVDSKMYDIARAVDRLGGHVAELQGESMDRQVDMWLDQKVFTNALRLHVKYLRHLQRQGVDWRVQRGLDKLEKILRTMIRERPGRRPEADDIADLSRFLDGAAKHNPVLVKTLQGLVIELCGPPEKV